MAGRQQLQHADALPVQRVTRNMSCFAREPGHGLALHRSSMAPCVLHGLQYAARMTAPIALEQERFLFTARIQLRHMDGPVHKVGVL